MVVVVTPVYNGEAYLSETLECVQRQTYPNLAHLVLDNASTDRTSEIIREFENRQVPLVVHRNPSTLRVGDNWNAAMRLVPPEAKYVRLLCADDLMESCFIEKTVSIAETDPQILLVGSNVAVNSNKLDFKWPQNVSVVEGTSIIRGFLAGKIGYFAIHMLMRRSVLEWRDPLFDADMLGFDFEMVLAVLDRGKFGMVHEYLGWARDHSDTLTSKVMLNKNTHYTDFLTALHRHGPKAFGQEEFARVKSRFEQHYIRKLRHWKKQGGEEAVALHREALSKVLGPIGPRQFFFARLDAVLSRLGLRDRWTGWPN